MPELFLKLKQVPEDEYHEVVEFLEENSIDFYETNAGFWGLGLAGIWLSNSDQYTKAHELLFHYQKARQVSARAEYEQSKEDGSQRTLWSTFMLQPGYFVLYLVIIVGLVAVTVSPFFLS